MDKIFKENKIGRDALTKWQDEIHKNVYSDDADLIHTIQYYFSKDFKKINNELEIFGEKVAVLLDYLVEENHYDLPKLKTYDGIGKRIDEIIHSPTYDKAGEIIYNTHILSKLASPKTFLEGLSLLFLSSQAGEAGHNCPIACSAGIVRVLQKTPDFPDKNFYLEKLLTPSYETNFTGAQFLTEIQGGSDVGINAAYAEKDENGFWKIFAEKWFCSNADADLIFITARFNSNISGTKGLGLFLIPAIWKDEKNNYSALRLKDKLGTRTMATAEIEFNGAYAIPMGLENGFQLVMENVLHLSRLLNSFTVVSMARRAYTIASIYAKNRVAFSNEIIKYPLIKETLAKIKAENTALLAGIFSLGQLQAWSDLNNPDEESGKLLLRLLVNILKYLTAKWSVEHIHHSLDILAGNGTIETFSSIPRLLRDCIVCENWEGTHNVLMMQVLKDIHKYSIDKLYLSFMKDKITKIDDQEYKKFFEKSIEQLGQDLSELRTLDHALQTLKIKMIVDRMSILFSCLYLLIEAMDQIKTGIQSKKYCFDYFYYIKLEKKEIFPDHKYLDLLNKIIEL